MTPYKTPDWRLFSQKEAEAYLWEMFTSNRVASLPNNLS